MLTVSDLNALLDCDPELASEYLEQDWLLQAADDWAPQAQDDCWSFCFEDGMTMVDKMKVGTEYDVLVALGAEEGTDVAQGVWYRHREEGSGAEHTLSWSQVAHRVLCGRNADGVDGTSNDGSVDLYDPNGFSQTCWQRWFESSDIIGAIPEALVLGIDGLTGPGIGRDVLKKLSAGSYNTLPAFRSEAIRAVTQLTWEKFGRYFVLLRFVLMILVYVPLHIFVLGRNDAELEEMRERLWHGSQPLKIHSLAHATARDLVEIDIVGGALGGFMDEMLSFTGALALVLIVSTLAMLHEEVWYAIIFKPEVHFKDMTNVLLLAQPIFTLGAIALVLLGLPYATVIAVIANILMWLRVLHYFQGIPIFGFMVYLIFESAKDMIPFLSLLIIILFAFASSWRPWAIVKPENMGEWMESEVNPLSAIPTGVLRSFLMLNGDWDMDEMSSSAFPWMSQMIFFFFVIVGPIVMINILIAILASTYDSVMDSQREVRHRALRRCSAQCAHARAWREEEIELELQLELPEARAHPFPPSPVCASRAFLLPASLSRHALPSTPRQVLLQLQLHETLALEHIYDYYEVACMRCCHRCLHHKDDLSDDEIERLYSCFPGRKPRWLHVLREDEGVDKASDEARHNTVTTKLDDHMDKVDTGHDSIGSQILTIANLLKKTVKEQEKTLARITANQAVLEARLTRIAQSGGVGDGGEGGADGLTIGLQTTIKQGEDIAIARRAKSFREGAQSIIIGQRLSAPVRGAEDRILSQSETDTSTEEDEGSAADEWRTSRSMVDVHAEVAQLPLPPFTPTDNAMTPKAKSGGGTPDSLDDELAAPEVSTHIVLYISWSRLFSSRLVSSCRRLVARSGLRRPSLSLSLSFSLSLSLSLALVRSPTCRRSSLITCTHIWYSCHFPLLISPVRSPHAPQPALPTPDHHASLWTADHASPAARASGAAARSPSSPPQLLSVETANPLSVLLAAPTPAGRPQPVTPRYTPPTGASAMERGALAATKGSAEARCVRLRAAHAHCPMPNAPPLPRETARSPSARFSSLTVVSPVHQLPSSPQRRTP